MRREPMRRGGGRGFTLIELLVVMVIIGLLLTFILSAAMDGVRRAEERATQALITKLEAGMTDRIDVLLTLRADANQAHYYMAGVWNTTYKSSLPTLIIPTNYPISSNSRAQTIAQFDRIKAELPDVFVVQGSIVNGSLQGDPHYPINFAAAPYIGTAGMPGSTVGFVYQQNPVYENYLLPLGVGVLNDGTSSFGANPPGVLNTTPTSSGYNPAVYPAHTGIFGASYSAAGALYKGLYEGAVRYAQLNNITLNLSTNQGAGYDGTDNNGDGLVDNLVENNVPGVLVSDKTSPAYYMLTLLAKHTHKTARSEMLYALLVNGQGPLGSVFSPDDFTDSEVRDTDGDGMLEFVDAWGEPLQFYRWPIAYVSEVQVGTQIYTPVPPSSGVPGPRDQNPLDPNKQLVDPSWWSNTVNNDSGPWTQAKPLSGPAFAFQSFFFALTDPNSGPSAKLPPAPAGTTYFWDRSAPGTPFSARREYYSKFLILSGGQDKTPGVPVLDVTYFTGSSLGDYVGGYGAVQPTQKLANMFIPPGGLGTYPGASALLALAIENQAGPLTPVRSDPVFLTIDPNDTLTAPLTTAIKEAGNDDITNHNLQAPGGATQ